MADYGVDFSSHWEVGRCDSLLLDVSDYALESVMSRTTLPALAGCFRTRLILAPSPPRTFGTLVAQRDLSSPYSTKTVDSSNGLLLPMFCEATGLLLLAGRCVGVC